MKTKRPRIRCGRGMAANLRCGVLKADRPRSAGPWTGLTAADIVRRFVERRIPQLGVACLARHPQVPHAPSVRGTLPGWRADTGLPADQGQAGPQRVAERATQRLVLEQGHRHEMIMSQP